MLLGVLARGESYGYEILVELKRLSGGEVDWAEGMLYPLLRRLEQQSLLKSRWVSPEEGRRRRYYKITKKGKAALEVEKERWHEASELLEKIWNPEKTVS